MQTPEIKPTVEPVGLAFYFEETEPGSGEFVHTPISPASTCWRCGRTDGLARVGAFVFCAACKGPIPDAAERP